MLLSTLIRSNYPSLELIFMVSKVFEPLKFDCTFFDIRGYFETSVFEVARVGVYSDCDLSHLSFKQKVVVVVVLLFYVHGKHLRSCRDGQLT